MNARALFAGVSGVVVSLGLAASGAAVAAPEEPVSYRLDVQPIVAARCGDCHSPGGKGYQKSGLDLTSYHGLMTGTKHGAIVVAGEPVRSNLIVLIEGRADPSLRMPHSERPLLKPQIQIIRDWVRQGAKDN